MADLAKRDFLPIISKEPGFIEYGVSDLGNQQVCSITIWESREQAQKSVNLASSWVREHLADRVKLVNSYVGELAFLVGSPVPA